MDLTGRGRAWGLAAVLALAVALAACGGVDKSSDPQQKVLETARAAADAALLESGDLPGDWRERPPATTPTTDVASVPQRMQAVYDAWQTCALQQLGGGVVGLNRTAFAQSRVFTGPEGEEVSIGSVVISRRDAAVTLLDTLRSTAATCVPSAPGLTSEAGELVVAAGPPVAARERMTVTFLGETLTQPFDVIAVQDEDMVSAAFMRNFEGQEEMQGQIVEEMRVQLADAAATLRQPAEGD
jgi:hypothetical protein